MSAVPGEGGRGVGAWKGQWAPMRLCPQLSARPWGDLGHGSAGIPTFALGRHLRVRDQVRRGLVLLRVPWLRMEA